MLKMPLQLSSQDGIWPARSRRLHHHHQLAYHHQKQQQQKQKQNGVQQGRSPTFMPVMLLLLMATLLTRPLSAFSNPIIASPGVRVRCIKCPRAPEPKCPSARVPKRVVLSNIEEWKKFQIEGVAIKGRGQEQLAGNMEYGRSGAGPSGAECELDHMEITLQEAAIPSQETTYWCHVQRLEGNLRRRHHIVQFEPLIRTPGIVHHMEVFHCEAGEHEEIPLYNGDCEQLPPRAKICSKVMVLWAMGAGTFTYPPEAGLPIGGPGFNPYVRLEVHFNNPEKQSGLVDNSGFRIKMSKTLRQYDAAVMELGLEYTDKMAIPPGQTAFPLSGYCVADCTRAALPATGIIIFGSQLHTHLRGVRVLTRHFRGEQELREVNRDDFYSNHFQEMRTLHYKPRVLPGDALVTTCYYNTKDDKTAALGGFSISDEMCVNYIHYYPATKLEVCKSSVSEETLENYFIYMKRTEHQHGVHLNGARSSNYRSIEWTQPRIDQLYTMYMQEPLSMQCNRSDGTRFEGRASWEGVAATPVQIRIPIHRKLCPNYNPLWLKPLEKGECDLLGECIY
ncbi:Tbh [Drosophila simulans]|uniref:Tbh n=1 Tax=Drosophila simulans TaxID=7240 RepID=B4R697_DROSI|nr:Tbh [Drosophila simulans]